MPTDKSKSPMTYDNMVEFYNQTSMYIGIPFGNKDFKKNFGDTQPFQRTLQLYWKMSQKV